jgi:hypothetical protein
MKLRSIRFGQKAVLALLAAISSVTWSWPNATGADVVKTFQETEESFANPGQGWMTMRRLPNGPGRFPYSVAYFRLNWEDLEPTEGQYNWRLIDEPIEAWARRDVRIAFRIMTTNAHSKDAIVCRQAQADVDPTSWLPGDQTVAVSLRVPVDLQAGQYTLGLALVDPAREKPAIRLAIDAPQTDRLYRLSEFRAK